jgi:replication factor C subunit 3/5
MTPADNEHHDRHIVQNVVKEIASNNNIESKSGKGFKVLIINEADRLTKDAQGGLRRTMEKYVKNCRMILLCNNVHKLIHPIRSRCLNIRVPAPSEREIAGVLSDVAKLEGSSLNNFSFTNEMFTNISRTCDRNLRSALVQLQASRFTKNTEGMLAPHKKEIK